MWHEPWNYHISISFTWRTEMKRLLKKFETVMVASAFAEEGEYETARTILREEEREMPKIRRTADKRASERKVLRVE
jgi:hypothetical protein